MLFFPYKFDLGLNKVPYLTILVSLVCIGVYLLQYMNAEEHAERSEVFCSKNLSHIQQMAMEKSLGDASLQACLSLMYELTVSENPQEIISRYADDSKKFSGLSKEDSKHYIHDFLSDEYRSYQHSVPPLRTKELWYAPHSWNPVTMVTSSFSHGSWDHVIGNLLFFYAFAAAVELIIGSLAFAGVILAVSFGTNISYSLAMIAVDNPLPTVGLSGVVMGMIAMLTYFLPTAKIRCFYWVLIKIGTVAISAWLLAALYIGVDIYTLMTQDELGGVNLIAHVSGAMLGFILGFAFFRKHKCEIMIERQDS